MERSKYIVAWAFLYGEPLQFRWMLVYIMPVYWAEEMLPIYCSFPSASLCVSSCASPVLHSILSRSTLDYILLLFVVEIFQNTVLKYVVSVRHHHAIVRCSLGICEYRSEPPLIAKTDVHVLRSYVWTRSSQALWSHCIWTSTAFVYNVHCSICSVVHARLFCYCCHCCCNRHLNKYTQW